MAVITVDVTKYRYRRGELVSAGSVTFGADAMIYMVNEGGMGSSYQRAYFKNGSSAILNYSGASSFDWIRCPEYKKATQEDGSIKLQYTTHGVRLNSIQSTAATVVSIVEAGQGVDENGENPTDVYAVTLVNGYKFYTDDTGRDRILNIPA